VQLPLIIDISRAMGIPVFIREGMEADDYIVSTARSASDDGWNVSIFSADKDLFQVINGNIKIIRPSKGVSDFKIYDRENFTEEYASGPRQWSITLRSSGRGRQYSRVPGIGDKTAKELIGRFGSLEGIFENLDEISKSRRSKLEENRQLAYSSRDLIIPQLTESVPLDELIMKDPDKETLAELCTRLSLRRLMDRLMPESKDTTSKASIKKSAVVIKNKGPAVTPVIEIGYIPEGTVTGYDDLFEAPELAMAAVTDGKTVFCLFDRAGRLQCSIQTITIL
jgi:5'-3' exonuclease